MKPLFKIIFEDNSTYFGGDYNDTKWLSIPKDKKIKTLFYAQPLFGYLELSGYDKYISFIECTKDLNGKKAGIQNKEFAYVIGKLKDKIICYKINLKTGFIEETIYNINSTFVKSLNNIGWRG